MTTLYAVSVILAMVPLYALSLWIASAPDVERQPVRKPIDPNYGHGRVGHTDWDQN